MGGAVVKAAQAAGLEEKEEVRKPVLAGEVEKSIALGRSGLIRNQKKAAVNLCRLAKDSDRVRRQIIDEGGILPLVQMCRSKSQEVQLLAFLTMGQLAMTNVNRCAPIDDRDRHCIRACCNLICRCIVVSFCLSEAESCVANNTG